MTNSTTPNEASLRTAEEARRQAMLANDSVALGNMLADALCYVHSSGGKDTRQSYVHKLSNGTLQYKTCEFLTPAFQLIGNVGLVTARMVANVVSSGNHREVANTYLAVWEHDGAAWKLLYLQGTPLPPSAPH
jgi:hypothetical protein